MHPAPAPRRMMARLSKSVKSPSLSAYVSFDFFTRARAAWALSKTTTHTTRLSERALFFSLANRARRRSLYGPALCRRAAVSGTRGSCARLLSPKEHEKQTKAPHPETSWHLFVSDARARVGECHHQMRGRWLLSNRATESPTTTSRRGPKVDRVLLPRRRVI